MAKLTSTNPSENYKIIGEVNVSSEKEIKEKVKLARDTQKVWQSYGVTKRVALLRTVIEVFMKRKKELATLISREMGMPISESTKDVEYGIQYFEWYLDNAEECLKPETTYEDKRELHRVFYEPVGVVAVIVPWNFPFSNFVWQVGQNLIAGNTVVFKHSEETSLFGKEIEKAFEISKFPIGVFNEVYGDGKVGEILVNQDIDMICFTGSSNTGKHLHEIAAKKFIPTLMELGGSAPGIVFEDANIDEVIDSIYTNKFLNCGQVCDGLKRLIVHESKFEEVVKKLKSLIGIKKIGIAENKDTQVGPLVAERQLRILKEQVEDAVSKGAKIEIGGKSPKNLKGAFYELTLITNVKQNMRIWQEEVFGPVLPIVPFKTYEEAIKLANDTKYGLGGYIFTKNRELFLKAAAEIKTGMISLNNTSYLMPCNPFGGCKSSGTGREHGKYGFHEITRMKLISMVK